MNTAAPKVSVVIPTFNRCDYIAETIESVLAQDYPAVEVIVVDDGSTDATQSVVQLFGNRIQVLTQPNSGQGAAVNRGLAAATGEYITLVSDDDPVLPGALSQLVDALEANLDALVAYPDWYVIGPNGDRIGEITMPEFSLVDMARHHLCMPGPCTLFRRSVVELTGGWDLRWRWVADYDFWLRIGLLGPMVHVEQFLATWRRHPTAATHAAPRLPMANEQIGVIEAFFARSDVPPEVRAIETEAMAAAWAVGFVVSMDGLESIGLPRFRIEDRLASYIDRPLPVAAARVGTALDNAVRQVDELTSLLAQAVEDRDTLSRHVEVLRRHIMVLGGHPDEASSSIGREP